MKNFLLFIIIVLVSSCSTNLSNKDNFIFTSDLPADEFVKESGKVLINQQYGFTEIIADSAKINDTLIIAVHGYDSRGYEWITSIISLAEKYNNTYFYRYNWEQCPKNVGKSLANSIDSLLIVRPNYNTIKIFGHSYGGLVVTFAGASLNNQIKTEIHTIAAPLAGYPRILNKCDLKFNDDNKIVYPNWDSNITHWQWRTQKNQDGAFRDLDFDPQDINFDNGKVIVLPETMNGQRLGHNWSITWVIDNYLSE